MAERLSSENWDSLKLFEDLVLVNYFRAALQKQLQMPSCPHKMNESK